MTADSVLERVRKLRGVTYEWRPDGGGTTRLPGADRRELGVIAQEVEAVFPEAVATNADGVKVVDYMGLVAVLIEAVKELDERVAVLEEAPKLP